MSAPELSPTERAHVDRIEQAPDALGLREEVLDALRPVFWPHYPTADRAADALLPLIERREAEAAERALRDAADDALACLCGHGFDWHHEERGCQYHGNGPSRCRCLRDAATAVHATLHARAQSIGGAS